MHTYTYMCSHVYMLQQGLLASISEGVRCFFWPPGLPAQPIANSFV